jgi:hypothetical protein
MWGRVEEDMTAVRCGVESERATLGADDPSFGADHGRAHETAQQTMLDLRVTAIAGVSG